MRQLHKGLCAVMVVLAAACAGGDTDGDDAANTEAATTPPPAAVPAPAPAAAPLTEPEIAHIAVTANMLDAEAGELAKGKATNPEVKQFAITMVTDHNASNKAAEALAKKLN